MTIKNQRIIGFLLIATLLLTLWPAFDTFSYADDDHNNSFIITREDYENQNGEYYSIKTSSNGKTTQEVTFKSIEIQGISNLKTPVLQQDMENHLTKYIFTIEDDMNIPENIILKYNVEGKVNGKDQSTKMPLIAVDRANVIQRNMNNTNINIREQGINTTPYNELGFVTCTAYYMFSTYDQTIHELQIVFRKEGVEEGKYLKELKIKDDTGIFADDPASTKTISAVASSNKDSISFGIETIADVIKPNIYKASVNDNGVIVKGDSISIEGSEGNNLTTVQLPASTDGLKYLLELSYQSQLVDQFVLTIYKRNFDDMPDKVVEYLHTPSQYVNTSVYGKNRTALLSLRGANTYSTTSEESDKGPFSLGNFGGYVTYWYQYPITDDPKNPYGIDFIIAGNSIINDALYAEPGNVYVSEDGSNWYILAGSLHYDDSATWDASVKYERNEDGTSKVTLLPNQTVIESYRHYPIAVNYPLFGWNDDNKREITLSGLMLKPSAEEDEYKNIVPPYPAFGYADCGTPSYSNEADNPYTGVGIGSTNRVESSGRKDGFDLAWAVDSQGKPHKFENGIHYVKIQTNTFIENAQTGINEKSTEINFMRKAESAPQPVGNTYDIEKDSSGRSGINISVDGKQLELKEGKYEYDATVNGIFDVQVDTRLNSNVYINSWHGNKATFDKAAHGIVRVIIQYGSCEPAIYYINVSQELDDNTVTEVTFDAVKGEGLISGYTKRTQYYDKDSTVKEFPVPKHRADKVFGGWADEDGNLYSEYSEDMPAQLTLTAVWRSPVENAKLIEEITKQIQQLQEQLDTVSGQLTQAQKDLDEKDGTISSQSDKITELTAQVAKISKDLEEAQQKLEEAKAKEALDAAALEEAQKTLAETQKSLEAVTKEADALRKELIDSSLDKIIASAEKTIQAAQDELSRTTNSFLRDALKSVISTAEKAIETAKASVDKTNETMRDGIDAVNGLKDQVAQSAAALAKAREELDKATAEGKASKEEAERLQKKVEEVQTELENVQKALDTSTSEKDGLQEQITQISGELSDANNKVAEAMEIIKIQQTTIKKVKAKAQKNKAKITWKKAGKGYKYEIYSSRRLSKGYKKVADIKKAKKVIKKLVSNKTYYFKVRGYKLINGEKVYTQFSEVVKATVK